MGWWRRTVPETQALTLLPIDTALFPGGWLDLRQLEAGLEAHLRALADTRRPLAASLIERPAERVHAVGTLAQVRVDAGTFRLLGGSRLKLLDTEVRPGPDRQVRAELMPAAPAQAVPDEFAALVFLLGQIDKRAPDTRPSGADPAENAEMLGYRLVEVLPVPPLAKQKLLELDDAVERLIIVRRYLAQRGLIS